MLTESKIYPKLSWTTFSEKENESLQWTTSGCNRGFERVKIFLSPVVLLSNVREIWNGVVLSRNMQSYPIVDVTSETVKFLIAKQFWQQWSTKNHL